MTASILSVDIGTTALKMALFDEQGNLKALAAKEYKLLTPSTLAVEMAANTYWEAFTLATREIMDMSGCNPEQIVALGISAQGETLVLVDRAGEPLGNAIVWLDSRAAKEAEILSDEFGDENAYRVSGQVGMAPTWPASKILWVRRNEPELFRQVGKYLLLEDYFIYRLTGTFVAEGSLLCSTLYWNITSKDWWQEMLSFLGVSVDQLPAIRDSGEVVGAIKPSIARELGLSPGTLVCTGALDQAAGAIGVGNIKPGVFSENTGAALAICATVNRPVFDSLRRMPCHYHGIPDTYMEHTFTTGGMVLRWYRDEFCQWEVEKASEEGGDAYDLMSDAASDVPPGAEGLVMLPHLQGAMAPDANPRAKGVFFGFTLRHQKGHFVRSIMEAIACIVRRNIDVLEELGIGIEEIRCLGGGARSSLWNQIKADLTRRPVVTTACPEAACLGAAILGGTAVGVFPSLSRACERMVALENRYDPNPDNARAYAATYDRYMELYDRLTPVFDGSSEAPESVG